MTLKFKIEFDAQRYCEGANPYSLTYIKAYDDGHKGSNYWVGAGHFIDIDSAKKFALALKGKIETVFFEV